ncbi:helix-turn-helix transcriptional regulator [Crossiella sp. CA-258035]|uniref:helix-turn-helix transcriptional regulator n=1 Tax=Crossiella sp. CA-258035 TaxID=2981138 RepID=UPI0024BC9B85|nr:helix-turn-helix transcriptional regulator [Crossiella sp. CA-258035]WHT16624.1 helix-turn-helix transcriptional regulator [Crossiella sp. CA-258035]
MDATTLRDRRAELRDFLRSRRARLTPAEVGLPETTRRRTPGLRREEVAVLAGVGVSWYTWLEQGRDITVSGEVLDAVARALRLAEPERAHLYRLAGLNPPEATGAVAVDPAQQRLLDGWLPNPAYLMDRHWNFLALNTAARRIFGYDLGHAHNCLVTFFTQADCRFRWADWRTVAADMVANFRAQSARYPEDEHFAELASDLSSVSPEFAGLWARHEVRERSSGTKELVHPEVGELSFDYTVLTVPDQPGNRLLLHLPTPGTPTADRLSQVLATPGQTDSG